MTDVQIDLTTDDNDGDEFVVENAELSWIKVTACGVTIEMRWEQAESLYRGLRVFFDDDPAA